MATLATPHPDIHVDSAEQVEPGVILADRYRIDQLIGEGGAGRVYAAEHVLLRKKVAIKILKSDRANVPDIVSRFEREAMAAANIEHPNIAAAIDFGRLGDGSVFLALEYVAGRSLRQELAKGPLSVARSLHIARQIASALAGAQALGIVHRDLKPENIMLLQRPEDPDFVKVLDFGIARVPMAEHAQPLTKAGAVFGTPAYMSPEQALGQRVDGRADLYAVGVMLFEMLVGKRPYDDQGGGILALQLAEAAPSFSVRAPGTVVPHELQALVETLLARDVAARLESADALTQAINALLADLAPPAASGWAAHPVSVALAPAPSPRGPGTPTFLPGDPLPAFELTTAFPDASVPRPSVPVSAGLPQGALPKTSLPPAAKTDDPIAETDESSGGPSTASSARANPGQVSARAAALARRAYARISEVSAQVGERALRSFQEACAFLDVQRRRLPPKLQSRTERIPSAAVVLSFLGASSAVLLLAVVGLTRSHTAKPAPGAALGLAINAAAASASATTTSNELPSQAVTAAKGALPANADEAGVLLELANGYTSAQRDAEAVALVQRVLLRKPELNSDPRVAKILSHTARSDNRAASEDSFALLEGPMAAAGAEVIYDVWREPGGRERVRRRAEAWLNSKDFDRVSSTALYSAVKLRLAKTCEQKQTLLKLASDVGGKQTLEYLHELEQHTTCTNKYAPDCAACLAAGPELKETIQRVSARLGEAH